MSSTDGGDADNANGAAADVAVVLDASDDDTIDVNINAEMLYLLWAV